MNNGNCYVFLSGEEDISINVPSFSMNDGLEGEMNKGIIPKRLKDKFETTDFPLSKNSTITIEGNNKWKIVDKKREKIYCVKKEAGQLKIYEIVGIEKLLNKYVSGNIAINCIKKHKNMELTRARLDKLKESSIYVVDTHTNFDNKTYWQLGYVMGKGIAIIGHYDGRSTKKIPSDVEKLISNQIPSDIELFLETITLEISNLKPKEVIFKEALYKVIFKKDWDKQRKTIITSKKGQEAT